MDSPKPEPGIPPSRSRASRATPGHGRALGRGYCPSLAQSGAHVAIVDVDVNASRKLAEELTAQGLIALAVQCDVTDEDHVAAAVKATVDTFASLDMAFNNAGIMLPPVDSADEEASAFDQIVAVTCAECGRR